MVIQNLELLLPLVHGELGPKGRHRKARRTRVCEGGGSLDDERAHVLGGRVATFCDVADQNGEELIDGRGVACGRFCEHTSSTTPADADKWREMVDQQEILVHGLVPGFEEVGTGGGEEVGQALGVKTWRGRRLRWHRREGGCLRRLNAHGERREAECRVVEGGKPAIELKSNGDLRDVRRLDTVCVGVEELGEGV